MCSEMEEHIQKPTIQLTGFKNEEKEALVELLFKLDCVFYDCEKYENCTHLIAKKVCKSEKWLAACAAGKWVLTKEYVIDSAKSGRWLSEATYEWGYKVDNCSKFSPQMQSAPKRWRENLALTGAPGAFIGWKAVLLIKEGDKRSDAFVRVLQAGKATVCHPLSTEEGITHVFTNNTSFLVEREKNLFSAPYYPVQYLGDFLLENTIESNAEDTQSSHSVSGHNQEEKHHEGDMLDIRFAEMKNALWKRLCLAQAIHQRYVGPYIPQQELCPEVNNIDALRVSLNRIEGLIEGHFFIEAIEELNFMLPYLVPPVRFLQTLLGHLWQGNIDLNFSCRFFDIFYSLLHLHPPWKSPSMLIYFLEVLQCPICKRGTWSLIEMLVRSSLDDKNLCHPISQQEIEFTDRRVVHGALLKYIVSVLQAETQSLSRRLCEWADSRSLEVMPQAVLAEIFWSENKASVFFTKPLNILVDWVIHAHREKYRADDVLKHQIAYFLNGILGAAVEYWILLGLLLDRYMMHHVSNDLANYISILCDDFSSEELEALICSIPSPWLQMFVSDAVFRTLCLKNNLSISPETLSLHKLVCSYLPALTKVATCEVSRVKNVKGRKSGQWPCPKSQRTLLMLNDDKQSQDEVLPDLPGLVLDTDAPLPKNLRRKLEKLSIPKENLLSVGRWRSPCKHNTKGETALHTACKHNKVDKLSLLLSWPGTDINVKDYAGWTPLHEACNHGSMECVQEILQRCPEADLLSQVDGVTPLHDALSNGHVNIGKLLLLHGGPVLLQQRDFEGKLPLDYIVCKQLKEKLFSILQLPVTIEEFNAQMEKSFYAQQIEFGSFLLCRILLNFCSVYDLSSNIASSNIRSLYPVAVTSVNSDQSVKKSIFFSDWLVEQYARNLETLQKLPELLTKLPECLKLCDGFHTQTLLAVLKTMIIHSTMATNT